MYAYDAIDQAIVDDRVKQFRGQVARRIAGALTEDEFKPLRLQNGLYLQMHAYMLRVAIPYGELSSRQLRQLALIARRFDKGYGHFTTRQNIQFNWLKLTEAPDALAALAEVQMHAIQTSGNCVRNITTDHLAGIAADEVADPRPYAEILRQWSTFHPEFAFLPRKFKIAIAGSPNDRAAVRVHDIGLSLVEGADGGPAFEVLVGGGLGRTPYLGTVVAERLPARHLLSFVEAILRVYNRFGRRDNIHKARIKILVHALGGAEFRRQVEEEWATLDHEALAIPAAELDRVAGYFQGPAYERLPAEEPALVRALAVDAAFAQWHARNVQRHKVPGYAAALVTLKGPGLVPGDATAEQMDRIADLADLFSHGELRITHTQNVVLPYVRQRDLPALHAELARLGLARGDAGTVVDMICCPGMDYCSLATARSIPVAQSIAAAFADAALLHDIGDLRLNISGCINSCGHHHVGHIGILGVDKQGEEFYQLTVGGSSAQDAGLGRILGPSLPAGEVAGAIRRMVDVYLAERTKGERFLDTQRRLGVEPFKAAVYGRREAKAA